MKFVSRLFSICCFITPVSVYAVDFPSNINNNSNVEKTNFPGQVNQDNVVGLTATSFPKTFNDLSFVDRVAVLKDGYAPWESEYDKDTGKCISNCAYDGITIETDLQQLQRNTEEAQAKLSELQKKQIEDSKNKKNISDDFKVFADSGYSCKIKKNSVKSNPNLPVELPLDGNPRVTSPFGKRIHPVTGNLQPHKGIDYGVPTGTNVYSPANGTVENVSKDSTCGNGLRIKHSNGFSSSYCHLNETDVKVGDKVGAGCLVAKSGNTGRSTGPHLHYAVYHNTGFIDPNTVLNYTNNYAFQISWLRFNVIS